MLLSVQIDCSDWLWFDGSMSEAFLSSYLHYGFMVSPGLNGGHPTNDFKLVGHYFLLQPEHLATSPGPFQVHPRLNIQTTSQGVANYTAPRQGQLDNWQTCWGKPIWHCPESQKTGFKLTHQKKKKTTGDVTKGLSSSLYTVCGCNSKPAQHEYSSCFHKFKSLLLKCLWLNLSDTSWSRIKGKIKYYISYVSSLLVEEESLTMRTFISISKI